MNALDAIEQLSSTSIILANLKYCLVDNHKRPFKIDGQPARPNDINDFVEFENLFHCLNLHSYSGIGISIQASNICAIDVDNCFSQANDITSADDRAIYFLEQFKDIAYAEFSFSGKGLRLLFKHPIISNYSDKYYIKNETYHIEYYQPNNSYRYVTLTGNVIFDNNINAITTASAKVFAFLDKYMQRRITQSNVVTTSNVETRTFEELMKLVKRMYLTDTKFQDLWFTNAPGSGKDESERDYHLVAHLFENVTQDKAMIKRLFESSNFFKTKDYHHIHKWTAQDGRYFNYLYDNIRRKSL